MGVPADQEYWSRVWSDSSERTLVVNCCPLRGEPQYTEYSSLGDLKGYDSKQRSRYSEFTEEMFVHHRGRFQDYREGEGGTWVLLRDQVWEGEGGTWVLPTGLGLGGGGRDMGAPYGIGGACTLHEPVLDPPLVWEGEGGTWVLTTGLGLGGGGRDMGAPYGIRSGRGREGHGCSLRDWVWEGEAGTWVLPTGSGLGGGGRDMGAHYGIGSGRGRQGHGCSLRDQVWEGEGGTWVLPTGLGLGGGGRDMGAPYGIGQVRDAGRYQVLAGSTDLQIVPDRTITKNTQESQIRDVQYIFPHKKFYSPLMTFDIALVMRRRMIFDSAVHLAILFQLTPEKVWRAYSHTGCYEQLSSYVSTVDVLTGTGNVQGFNPHAGMLREECPRPQSVEGGEAWSRGRGCGGGITVDKPFRKSLNVNFVKLPTSKSASPDVKGPCTVIGWGETTARKLSKRGVNSSGDGAMLPSSVFLDFAFSNDSTKLASVILDEDFAQFAKQLC
uniref:Uncharacterized protein n=1 Tax=Timema poppense TaxID=170557 RepID=A0A7R9DEI8_TIMPO|nr:unnamed protein product [Timema poppensis]